MNENICICGGNLEFLEEHKFIECKEGYITGVFICDNCLKEFINVVAISELEN